MIGFWIAAALLSAGMAALVVHRAAHAARLGADAGGDPALAVYRRQLAEIDDLAERGLIPAEERRSAKAEASRRLLGAADRSGTARFSPSGGRGLAAAAAAGAPLAALLAYLFVVGSPETPDQPFAARAAAWRAVDPASLDPQQMTVVLQGIARQRPGDPNPLYYLARAQEASGDPFSAEQSLRRALDLAPTRADLWSSLGEAITAQSGASEGQGAEKPGTLSEDARAAFARAATLNPSAPAPPYFLARDRIARGDIAGGLAAWRALLDRLAPQDPRRTGLAAEIAEVEKTGALPLEEGEGASAAPPQSPGADQNAFIRAMVGRLAARLEANPNDPAGWARLIRAYQVLGDQPRRAAAIARAQVLFKGQPQVLRGVMAAARGPS